MKKIKGRRIEAQVGTYVDDKHQYMTVIGVALSEPCISTHGSGWFIHVYGDDHVLYDIPMNKTKILNPDEVLPEAEVDHTVRPFKWVGKPVLECYTYNKPTEAVVLTEPYMGNANNQLRVAIRYKDSGKIHTSSINDLIDLSVHRTVKAIGEELEELEPDLTTPDTCYAEFIELANKELTELIRGAHEVCTDDVVKQMLIAIYAASIPATDPDTAFNAIIPYQNNLDNIKFIDVYENLRVETLVLTPSSLKTLKESIEKAIAEAFQTLHP